MAAPVENALTQNKVKFSFYNYNNGIFFDEKKKRFVDFVDMDFISYKNYNNPFAFYRPDYYGTRSLFHDLETFSYAQTFLQHMAMMRSHEMARMSILFRRNAYFYMQPLYDFHIKYGNLDKSTDHKYLKWDDACLTINYFHYVIDRVKKYGLNYGPLAQGKFPNYKDVLKSEEDRLTEYFLYEMRKEPQPEKDIPEMHAN
jgi:hypothetical protein